MVSHGKEGSLSIYIEKDVSLVSVLVVNIAKLGAIPEDIIFVLGYLQIEL